MVSLILLEPTQQAPAPTWHFPQLSRIRIGRHRDNELVLFDFPTVSRFHAEICQVNAKEWKLISYGVNGTFVNDVFVTEVLLQENDRIRFAPKGPVLSFQLSNEKMITTLPALSFCDHQENAENNLFCIHCGQPMVTEEILIRRYQILRTLGQGGMGTTYLGWDKEHPKQAIPHLVVIKEINANIAHIPKAQELFEREARILQSLNHSGIPQYHDFFLEKGQKYLVMELIHGQNLEDYIQQRGTVSVEQAIDWMKQTCEILAYLHGLNPPLVHRDVKPANLLLKAVERRIMLIDFGAVKEIGAAISTRIGVEGYTAPEQNLGKFSPQADLYAVGTTLVYLITGESPLTYFQTEKEVTMLNIAHFSQISASLTQIIRKATQLKIGDRYQTAIELYQALDSVNR